ncbi:MAG TPA: TonB family protein [Bdellovibrionales bacterium]|nr:TonB family protein [Bdellovibrionales bacterium]
MNAAGRLQRFRDQEPVFYRMLLASVGLHIAVLLAFTIRTYVFPTEALNFETAIKVDIVDLPDKHPQLPPVAEEKKPADDKKPAPLETKPETKPKETKKQPESNKVDLNAKKKEKAEALEKIKAMQALDNIADEVKREEEERERQRLASQKIKGNVLSKGTALKGIVSTQMAGYVNLLERHAKDNWTIPKWLEDLNLKARAHVFLNEDGTVARRTIVQSSGNDTYDDLVLSSIDKASPFPPPPKHFIDLVKTKGIQLGFPE